MSATDTTHTPGPWTVGPHDLTSEHPTIRANGWTVGYANHTPWGGTPEANARVMAAAPDLLAAAEAVLEWARTPGNHGGNPYTMTHVQAAVYAVAKVRGINPEEV